MKTNELARSSSSQKANGKAVSSPGGTAFRLGKITSFFVAPGGTIAAMHTGPLSQNQIEAYLAALP